MVCGSLNSLFLIRVNRSSDWLLHMAWLYSVSCTSGFLLLGRSSGALLRSHPSLYVHREANYAILARRQLIVFATNAKRSFRFVLSCRLLYSCVRVWVWKNNKEKKISSLNRDGSSTDCALTWNRIDTCAKILADMKMKQIEWRFAIKSRSCHSKTRQPFHTFDAHDLWLSSHLRNSHRNGMQTMVWSFVCSVKCRVPSLPLPLPLLQISQLVAHGRTINPK